MKSMIIASVLSIASILRAASAPIEVWLTPERKAALERITSRPRVVSHSADHEGHLITRWTNGANEWVVTNKPAKNVLGKKAGNGWQKKLDEKEAEKRAILDDLETIKSKPTKKAVEDIITKHKKAGKTK